MDKRRFGRTGLDVSLLGFGCGAVGGLMIKGTAADQERAVGRALELGINYFDTAQMYGNGESERNLGRVLKSLKPDVYVGTKVRLPPTEPGKIGAAIAASLEASLARLQMDSSICFSFTTPSSAPPRAPISPRPLCWRKSCRPSSCCAPRASCASSASPLTARPRRC